MPVGRCRFFGRARNGRRIRSLESAAKATARLGRSSFLSEDGATDRADGPSSPARTARRPTRGRPWTARLDGAPSRADVAAASRPDGASVSCEDGSPADEDGTPSHEDGAPSHEDGPPARRDGRSIASPSPQERATPACRRGYPRQIFDCSRSLCPALPAHERSDEGAPSPPVASRAGSRGRCRGAACS